MVVRARVFDEKLQIKLYRTRGLNPRVQPQGRAAASLPCGVMDRDSTGETPSALYPPQEAGFTLNEVLRVLSLLTALIDRRKENLRYAVEEIWLKQR